MNAELRDFREGRLILPTLLACMLVASCASTEALTANCESALECGNNDRCARGHCTGAALAYSQAMRYEAMCSASADAERCRCEAAFYVLGLGKGSCGNFRFYDPPPARVATYLDELDATPTRDGDGLLPTVECGKSLKSEVCAGGGVCMKSQCVPWAWVLAAARKVLPVCERLGGPPDQCKTFVAAWLLFEAAAHVRFIEQPPMGTWYDDLVLEDPFLWEPPPPPEPSAPGTASPSPTPPSSAAD